MEPQTKRLFVDVGKLLCRIEDLPAPKYSKGGEELELGRRRELAATVLFVLHSSTVCTSASSVRKYGYGTLKRRMKSLPLREVGSWMPGSWMNEAQQLTVGSLWIRGPSFFPFLDFFVSRRSARRRMSMFIRCRRATRRGEGTIGGFSFPACRRFALQNRPCHFAQCKIAVLDLESRPECLLSRGLRS